MAEESAAKEHLAARSWKLVRNADINISSPSSTACDSVENLDPVDGDCFAVVNSNPGCTFIVCMAHIRTMPSIWTLCVSINALGC